MAHKYSGEGDSLPPPINKESLMEELKLAWPVDKCPACNFDLREATPKATEKGKDTNGKLIWTDFCRQCGHGLVVGARELPPPPAEELARMEAAPIIGSETKPEVNPDPEGQLKKEPTPPPENKPAPGEVRVPGPGEYFCTKCASIHKETSGVGKRHSKKYRE